jgi:cellulose synthase/poly-beta-1,6-N-acetylglucosamine synthase-like glycosyltransferase
MIASVLAVASIALAISLLGLLAAGARWSRSHRGLTAAYGALVLVPAYLVGELVWELPRANLWAACVLVFASIVATSFLARDWNPAAQAFLGTTALTALTFVLFAAEFTLSGGLPALAYPASFLLIALEAFALLLLLVGAHEVLDVVGRTRWRRRTDGRDRGGWTPFVSIHVPTHNEPPELVLETLRSLRALDYPAYEILVLDNNTVDETLWRPVQRYCDETGIRFVHLEDWPGFKAGALNRGLEILDDRTEIVAVVDADFLVESDFLSRTVGYFADRETAIVQTAQAFRIEPGSAYLRRLALAYRAFDEVTMPSRNERNAIIFAGTMGLLRRSALVEAGGWEESCVTEDAEVSLRILARGYRAVYVERSFGRGVMPLTFAALKRQRFRWCFGGIQVLRRHWKLLVLGRGVDAEGRALRLTRGQRYDYLSAGLQWFNALVSLVFSVFLLVGVASRALGSPIALRPLVGLFVAVPALVLLTGVVKALWGVRARLRVSWADAVGVFGIWLAVTWAVALACIQGLTRREGTFLRTPKFRENESFRQALRTTKIETTLALMLAASAFLAAASGAGLDALFLTTLCTWSALVFFSAPLTAFLAARIDLGSAALRKRRRLESLGGRPRIAGRPVRCALAGVGALAFFAATATSLTVVPKRPGAGEIFALPHRSDDADGVRIAAPAARVGVQRPARGSSAAEPTTERRPASGRAPTLVASRRTTRSRAKAPDRSAPPRARRKPAPAPGPPAAPREPAPAPGPPAAPGEPAPAPGPPATPPEPAPAPTPPAAPREHGEAAPAGPGAGATPTSNSPRPAATPNRPSTTPAPPTTAVPKQPPQPPAPLPPQPQEPPSQIPPRPVEPPQPVEPPPPPAPADPPQNPPSNPSPPRRP